MLLPVQLYPVILAWLNALEVGRHRTGRAALAALVTAVLVAQSLRPTALMRALLSPRPVPARQRYKRLARLLGSPWLTPAWLTPVLVRAALSEVPPTPSGPLAGLTHLALDSLRCGRWEIFTLGVVWAGRTLPVGWTVLPYPWPPGQFTPTVCQLLRRGGRGRLARDGALAGAALGQCRRPDPVGAGPADRGGGGTLDDLAGGLWQRGPGGPRHAGGRAGLGGPAPAPAR